MGIIQYISISIIVLTVLLGLIVFAHGPKNRINQIFILLTFVFDSWIITNLMTDISSTESQLLFWGRMGVVGPLFMPGIFSYFFLIFPKQNEKRKKYEMMIIYLLFFSGIIGLFLIPTKFNIKGVEIINNIPKFQVGALYELIFLALMSSIIFSIYIINKKWSLLDKKEKKQVLLILIGIITAIIAGLITHVILVILFDFQKLLNIGPLFSIFITLFTAYSIIRHSSFSINLFAAEVFIAIILVLLSFEILLNIDVSNQWINIIGITAYFLIIIISYFLIRNLVLENERKKQIQFLTHQLENTNQELKKLNQLKDDFIYLSVHEINTPMASILGYLSLILDEKIAKVDKKAEKYLRIIYANCKRLANIVSSFLDVAKIEGGKIKLEFTKIKMEELFQEILLEYEEKAKAKNNQIKMRNFSLDESTEVEVDKDKIKEVFVNLIENAIKFTNNGLIEIFINIDREECKICVKDNGAGIPSEKLGEIFNKFYQAAPNIPQCSGTGLGLYITKSLIDMHNGSIRVESILGKGTKFIVSLPLKR